MIDIRSTATGAALAGFLLVACRDAPTVPEWPEDSLARPSFSADSAEEIPGPARIISAYTTIDFADGSFMGAQSFAEFSAGMKYIGNRAWMKTNYSITGEGYSKRDNIVNEQNATYDFRLEKNFEQVYVIPTNKSCGLLLQADTQHHAWWQIWARVIPDHLSGRDIKFTEGTPYQIEPCEPEAPSGGGGGDGSTSYGWITIETCHYMAHYYNGLLAFVEFLYCEYDTVPVADE